METKSLKALAHAVLERNRQGNSAETKPGNMETQGAVENPPWETVSGESFRNGFNRLMGHCRQRDYTPEDMEKLKASPSRWIRAGK